MLPVCLTCHGRQTALSQCIFIPHLCVRVYFDPQVSVSSNVVAFDQSGLRSSLDDRKRLKLAATVILQTRWRSVELIKSLVACIPELLSHPLKQVGEGFWELTHAPGTDCSRASPHPDATCRKGVPSSNQHRT